MNSAELIETHQWNLFSIFGYKNPLLAINSEIVIHTWVIIGLLTVALTTVHYILHNTHLGRFILIQIVDFFVGLTKQSLGKFVFSHCVFAASLFIFIALCNTAPIIPWLDEPTRDINTALALGIISFIYIQINTIKLRGVGAYIKDFFKPFFIMLPLNILAKLSSIISISFRLFGNIFGGSIITKLYFTTIQISWIAQLIGIFSGINVILVLFFTLFEGLLQAFVFAMLTLTYLSIGAEDSH
jgi:F-type H+-transporting ATPase subunit a